MKQGSLNGSLTRWLIVLIFAATLNVSVLSPIPAFAAGRDAAARRSLNNDLESAGLKQGVPVTYGIDADHIPFALKDDGFKARYLSVSPAALKVSISNGSALGEVEFLRKSEDETLTTFTPTSGGPFLIRTVVSHENAVGKAPDFDLIFQSGKAQAAVEVRQSRPLAPGAEQRAQEVISAAKSNPVLVSLTREAAFFLSKPVMSAALRRALQFELHQG